MRLFRRRRPSFVYFGVAGILFLGIIWYFGLTRNESKNYFDGLSNEIFSQRIKRYVAYQESEDHRSGPGEKGVAVVLQGPEKVEAEALMPKEAFNRIASDKISLERSLPDVRDQA